MTYVHDKKTMGKKVNLNNGLGITKNDEKRAVSVKYVIDVDKRSIKDKVNTDEPKFTK